jgi:hypothetical protein
VRNDHGRCVVARPSHRVRFSRVERAALGLLVIIPVASLTEEMSSWRTMAPADAMATRGGLNPPCCVVNQFYACSASDPVCEYYNGTSCRYNGSNYICTAVGCQTITYNVVNGYCYGANYCGPGNIRWNNYQCTKPCTIKHKCDNECESCYGVPCNHRCFYHSSCTGFCSGCCKTFRTCISSSCPPG